MDTRRHSDRMRSRQTRNAMSAVTASGFLTAILVGCDWTRQQNVLETMYFKYDCMESN